MKITKCTIRTKVALSFKKVNYEQLICDFCHNEKKKKLKLSPNKIGLVINYFERKTDMKENLMLAEHSFLSKSDLVKYKKVTAGCKKKKYSRI